MKFECVHLAGEVLFLADQCIIYLVTLGGFSITGECPLFRHLETPSHVTFQEQLKESVQARLSEVGCVPPELMQLPDAKVANFETNRCKLEAVYRRDGFTWQLEVLGG